MFKYEIISEKDKTCKITEYTGSDTVLNIPPKLDGYAVTKIGGRAFAGCVSLISVIIPDSVTEIGISAFEDCTALTSVTIPDSVTCIGWYVFDDCTSLENIEVDSKNLEYSSVDGVLFDKEQTVLVCYPLGKSNVSYTIPDGVTSIDDSAFFGCTPLKSITIPDSVGSINRLAFAYCTSLESIIIPDSVFDIDDCAFKGCSSLTSVTISSNIEELYADVFERCENLTDLYVSIKTEIAKDTLNRLSALPNLTLHFKVD